jgi:hypothetical protein
MTTNDTAGGTGGGSSSRRRLLSIVVVAVAVGVVFVATTIYAEHRASNEDARVRRVGTDMTFSDSDLLGSAYLKSDLVSRELGVSGDRVEITVGGGVTCIVVRTESLTSTRVSSFLMQGGTLSAPTQC